jgi:hypothetical protein
MIARMASGPKNQGSAKSTLPFRMPRQCRTVPVSASLEAALRHDARGEQQRRGSDRDIERIRRGRAAARSCQARGEDTSSGASA